MSADGGSPALRCHIVSERQPAEVKELALKRSWIFKSEEIHSEAAAGTNSEPRVGDVRCY